MSGVKGRSGGARAGAGKKPRSRRLVRGDRFSISRRLPGGDWQPLGALQVTHCGEPKSGLVELTVTEFDPRGGLGTNAVVGERYRFVKM